MLAQITARFVGAVIAEWLALAQRSGSWVWRLLTAIQIILIAGSLVLILSAPESPRYELPSNYLLTTIFIDLITGGL